MDQRADGRTEVKMVAGVIVGTNRSSHEWYGSLAVINEC
jgi:hypothetical protein